MMEFTAEMIAGFLGGDIVGNKDAKVHTVSSIEEGRAGSLAYLTNPKYEPFLYTTGASSVRVVPMRFCGSSVPGVHTTSRPLSRKTAFRFLSENLPPLV